MSKNKPAFDIYQAVTDKMIAKLEEGIVPWQKPWTSDESAPRNLISGKAYRGINIFLLGMQGYASPFWVTYKQASELGYRAWLKRSGVKDTPEVQATYAALPVEDRGGVRKGEKSSLITFWKIMKGKDKATGDDKSFPMLRYFNVFNVEQCVNLDLKLASEVEEREPIDSIDACEMIVAEMPNAPEITHGGARACYSPQSDKIQMPVRDDFKTSEGYYSTIFHEMVHSTGHKSRLNRSDLTEMVSFGSESYSREELTAEMGAAMLCATAGIEPDYSNSAAYLKGWLSKLRDDKKLLIGAAGKAQKAADHILNIAPDTAKKDD